MMKHREQYVRQCTSSKENKWVYQQLNNKLNQTRLNRYGMLKVLRLRVNLLVPVQLTLQEIKGICDRYHQMRRVLIYFRFICYLIYNLNITMRYIRPTANNKENKQNSLKNQYDRQRMEQLKLEIKSAYTQINMLRESNKKLLWKVEVMEKQMQNHELIEQQVQFLKEQQNNYKQQLNNQDEINRKLREELDRTERQRIELVERLRAFSLSEEAKPTKRFLSNRSDKISPIQDARGCLEQYKSISARSSYCMSLGSDRSKQNHQSTPKSKIKINLDQLIAPQNPNLHQKRKVFF